MLKIQVEDLSPRFSMDGHRSSVSLPFSPLMLVDDRSRKSSSYSKLPEEPIKLSVLKLDGSSFDVEVMKTATLAELREAVEDVFSHMPKKGVGKISWPHVWGHFCLCFDGQKLLTETDYISNYCIKDGDQLYFIRHHSPCYSMVKKRSKKRVLGQKQRNMSWLLRNNLDVEEQNDQRERLEEQNHNDMEVDDSDDIESGHSQDYYDKDEDFVGNQERKLTHFFRGCFSYSSLPSVQISRPDRKHMWY
ncbi:ATP synthase subunit b' isoform 2 [Tripterygium wilfordii]|uniref:ATP synthase subunit b' isoform 2 n=1 Tax=Tripterygium wilfordii TaxID=458696 RepID=A0A7J7BWI1_TRIWF|nr:ATP synthase subunit b' isoform 2 [Tripterygium wilfordii]